MLAKNLAISGIMRSANSAAHHIVPGNDSRGDVAREILSKAGVDINDVSNGVFLPKNSTYANPPAAVYSSLHTDRYYKEITDRLLRAKSSEINSELKKIGNELQQGTFPR